jgi:hypothetical protein
MKMPSEKKPDRYGVEKDEKKRATAVITTMAMKMR